MILTVVGGFCGVVVPRPVGDQVIDRLGAARSQGPVVGSRYPRPRYTFLAEADTVVESSEITTRGGILLQTSSRIRLPSPQHFHSDLYWVIPPDPSCRWLPKLSTLVWALQATTLSQSGSSFRNHVE
ncbi:hypothetical protein [Nocardia sp. bgisy134]|uniref:hypothetical protein n=1 Tax=Nocardia sp. bgisy134 TaxID=3413789 RepID=UPI003D734BE9